MKLISRTICKGQKKHRGNGIKFVKYMNSINLKSQKYEFHQFHEFKIQRYRRNSWVSSCRLWIEEAIQTLFCLSSSLRLSISILSLSLTPKSSITKWKVVMRQDQHRVQTTLSLQNQVFLEEPKTTTFPFYTSRNISNKRYIN